MLFLAGCSRTEEENGGGYVVTFRNLCSLFVIRFVVRARMIIIVCVPLSVPLIKNLPDTHRLLDISLSLWSYKTFSYRLDIHVYRLYVSLSGFHFSSLASSDFLYCFLFLLILLYFFYCRLPLLFGSFVPVKSLHSFQLRSVFVCSSF